MHARVVESECCKHEINEPKVVEALHNSTRESSLLGPLSTFIDMVPYNNLDISHITNSNFREVYSSID